MNLPVVRTSSWVFESGMELYPAVTVHGPGDALAALAQAAAEGTSVTLLSASGAALYAGCGWWREVVAAARSAYPDVPCLDILDCADGTGQALAALRIGVSRLVLWPAAPGRDAAVAIAEAQGGFVLAAAPAAKPPVAIRRETTMRRSLPAAEPIDKIPASVNGDKCRPPG